MNNEFRKLGGVAAVIMGLSPKGDTYNRVGDGLPLLNGPTEFGSVYPNCTLYTIDSKRECEKGDLIFCVRGNTTGRMNWADRKYSLGRGVCSVRGETPLDTIYLRYCIEAYLPEILQNAGGSTMPNLRQADITRFEVPYPLSRGKIAAILSAYGDLIENNLRRITILEEMAQNLYCEWFVKFRFPDHENVRMVDSALGEIPEGWKVQTVADTFQIVGGGTPSKKVSNYWEEGSINWYTPTDLTSAGTMFMEESRSKITELGLKKSSARLFPERSVMMTSRATLGVIAINTTTACTNQGFITCLPSAALQLYTLYHWLRENVDCFIALGTGATFKEITKGTFKRIELIVPPHSLAKKFEQEVSPLGDEILCLQRKNKVLRPTRDLLLPKLISGELDVSELDIAVPEGVA